MSRLVARADRTAPAPIDRLAGARRRPRAKCVAHAVEPAAAYRVFVRGGIDAAERVVSPAAMSAERKARREARESA